MSAHEKKEMKLAIMLMIVVVVFLICNILALIVNILELFGIDINEVTETSNLLVTINSSVNFFIYIIFGEKFKKQLCQCFEEISCFKRLSVLWNRYLSLYIVYSCLLSLFIFISFRFSLTVSHSNIATTTTSCYPQTSTLLVPSDERIALSPSVIPIRDASVSKPNEGKPLLE